MLLLCLPANPCFDRSAVHRGDRVQPVEDWERTQRAGGNYEPELDAGKSFKLICSYSFVAG